MWEHKDKRHTVAGKEEKESEAIKGMLKMQSSCLSVEGYRNRPQRESQSMPKKTYR